MKNLVFIALFIFSISSLWSQSEDGVSVGIGKGISFVGYDDDLFIGHSTDIQIAHVINNRPLRLRYSGKKLEEFFSLFRQPTELTLKTFELSYPIINKKMSRGWTFRMSSGMAFSRLKVNEEVEIGTKKVEVPYPISQIEVGIYQNQEIHKNLFSFPLRLELDWAFLENAGVSMNLEVNVPLGHDLVERKLTMFFNIGKY